LALNFYLQAVKSSVGKLAKSEQGITGFVADVSLNMLNGSFIVVGLSALSHRIL
jgi:hypothetical protein